MKSHVRYFIVFMLFFASTINYADRATLSIAKTGLSKSFGLDSVAMGYLLSAWAWSYVIAQIPAGWLLDRFGSKRVYGISIFLWSLFVFLMGFTRFLNPIGAFIVLFALLFLAGFALAPAFPGNGRFVAAWFPTKERGIASAIFNSSQYFSLVLFAPLMGWIVQKFEWPYLFWAMGLIGIMATPLWFKFAHSPKDHPNVDEDELKYIEQGGGLVNMDLGGHAGACFNVKWSHVRQLLGSRMLIGVYLGQFCITTITYFFIQWFPGYLESCGMSILKVGFVAALPALCGCVGGIFGGWFSDSLLRRGLSLSFARKLPIVLGMLLSGVMIGCNYVKADWAVIVIMCVAFFGKGFGALGWTVVSDTSPREIMGLSGGLFNTFGNTSAITTAIVIGYLVRGTGGFSAALIFVGATALGAIFCYVFLVGEIKRFELKPLE
ncbi:MAG TPA: MFS transporter [Candidatus Methylacidiphilales bacterium]|nr:MFS transporter [Candidatus Methylacidiphilales bacterium]